MTEDEWVDTLINGEPGSLEYSRAVEFAVGARKAEFLAKGVRPPVGHKITRVHVPIESIETRNVLKAEGADWPGSPTFPPREKKTKMLQQYSDMEMAIMGAQGMSPPEPAKGMNGPTGAPHEIPVTEEMVAEIRGRGMCAGWTDNVVAEFYRLMRAKEPSYESWMSPREQEFHRIAEAALARAEAAEGMILAIESNAGFYQELADRWKERARTAETRLAERNAPLRLLAARNPPR